jgi:GTP pyrophosphokinase
VPLESPLSSGDVIEVFTSKSENAGPSRDWLQFAQSPRARSKIKAWFSKERREEAIESGKDSLTKAMRKASLPMNRLMSPTTMQVLLADLHMADASALFAAVGEGRVSAASVVQRLLVAHGGSDGATEDIAEAFTPRQSTSKARPAGDPGIVVDGDNDVWVKLARCCTPVPGDKVLGYVTRGSGVSVHRLDCINTAQLQTEPDRIVPVTWAPTASSVFLVNIQVEALDRSRLLSDVTRALSDQHVNILSAAVSTTRDRIALSRFTFEMADATHLEQVLKSVRTVEGVYDVYRV